MKKIVSCFILLAFVCSCQSNKGIYSWDRTDSVAMNVYQVDSLYINSFGFVYCDNTLITADLANHNKRFVACKIDGDSIVDIFRFLNIGRAANEVLSANIYGYNDHLLLATNQRMVSIEKLYKISDVDKIADMESYQRIEIPRNEIWEIAPIDEDNYLVTFAGHKHDMMFGVLNISAQEIRELNFDYPGEHEGVRKSILSSVYRGMISKRPSGQEYLYSTSEGNCVMMFGVDNGKVVNYKELYSRYPEYVLTKEGRDYKPIRDNNLDGYIPFTTDRFIYLLNRFQDQPKGNVIEVFDWQGNSCRKIVLDRGLIRIAVNEDDTMLYGLTCNEDGEDEIVYAAI